MKLVKYQDLIQSRDLTALTEMCKVAGATVSTVIYSADKVVVYYKDPYTNSVFAADFVDEFHIQHQKSARIFIAIFPEDDML